MPRFLLIVLFLAVLPGQSKGGTPGGYLVVVGGGKTNDAVMKRTLELAGGTQALVVILPQASELADAGAKSAEMWRGFGASNVVVASDLDEPSVREVLARAALIWMPGGDQKRLMKACEESGLSAIIRERYLAGIVVGGTSAGAAVMSALMITGEADLQSIAPQATTLSKGLGLWPEVIVDQHFLKRQRFNRLLAAVLDHPEKIGVGIDEETAVIVAAEHWEVMGNSGVLVLDARDDSGKPPARNAKLHWLVPGMIWKP